MPLLLKGYGKIYANWRLCGIKQLVWIWVQQEKVNVHFSAYSSKWGGHHLKTETKLGAFYVLVSVKRLYDFGKISIWGKYCQSNVYVLASSQRDHVNEHNFTCNKEVIWMKPVELQVEAQLDGLKRDQKYQIHHWYRT